jgi:hypothetical protein
VPARRQCQAVQEEELQEELHWMTDGCHLLLLSLLLLLLACWVMLLLLCLHPYRHLMQTYRRHHPLINMYGSGSTQQW